MISTTWAGQPSQLPPLNIKGFPRQWQTFKVNFSDVASYSQQEQQQLDRARPAPANNPCPGAEAMKRQKQLIHAKTTRRQNRYFGDLSPQDIVRHDRKLADLRRADAVNDVSLEVTARRLARGVSATDRPGTIQEGDTRLAWPGRERSTSKLIQAWQKSAVAPEGDSDIAMTCSTGGCQRPKDCAG